MRIENEVLLDFDDVLIKPKRSEAPSRSHVDLNRQYKFLHSDITWEGVPLIAANMSTTGTFAMARVLSNYSMMTCLHKFYSIEDLYDFYRETEFRNVFYTTGIRDEDIDKLKKMVKAVGRVPFVCIDAANGYTKFFADKVGEIRKLCPHSVLMAGNVCTGEMVQELVLNYEVSIVKAGTGGGGACLTRIATAVGIPQLSAIIDCSDSAHGLKSHVVSDGGCRNSGHVVRAFGAGADFVMLGTMLAGTDECEGDWIRDENGNRKKIKFFGMSSEEAMDKFYGGKPDYVAAEGCVMELDYKGPVVKVIKDIMGGLRSACTYVGADKLKDLSKCTTFVRVNRVHDLRH